MTTVPVIRGHSHMAYTALVTRSRTTNVTYDMIHVCDTSHESYGAFQGSFLVRPESERLATTLVIPYVIDLKVYNHAN